ncbi:MAG TPA: hypothetical protein VNM91_00600 [Dehalococcoidia bacterium]|nr:hypothetical protein [Dehalococcoidia bacterium]
MGKKRRHEGEADGRQASARWQVKTWQWAALGVAVVAISAGIAIGMVTLLGGSELSEAKPGLEVPGPIGPPPEIARSAAADILANKTWDEMTEEERALVRSEMERVYKNIDFRVRDEFILALDLARRDGQTIAARRYTPVETPGGRTIAATITQFFCTSPDDPATANVYEYGESPLQTPTPRYQQRPVTERPLNRLLSAADWSTAQDIGFRDIDGRRAHGFRMQFANTSGTGTFEWEYWVDVENARVLEVGPQDDPNTYHIDYRQYAPIVPPIDEDVPCADIYD